MHANDDGSVLLNSDEARAVARVLDLGRCLCEDMGVGSRELYGAQEHHLEVQLSSAIDLLEELGVSSEELTEKLDQVRRPG